MWSIHFIAAVVLLLLVMQWSNARNLNVASGIANRQLTIEESRGSSVRTTSSSTDENNCFICLEHVGRNESASPNYPSSKGSYACGHGIHIHEKCLNIYLGSKPEIPSCSICRKVLKLTDAQKDILAKRILPPVVRTENIEDMASEYPMNLERLVARWPGILEIGLATLTCFRETNVSLMACAIFVIHNPDMEDVVSPMMNQYLTHPDGFYESQISRLLSSFSHFSVYNDVDGNLITIHEAYRRSLHFGIGAAYHRDLQHISASLSSISEDEIVQQMSRFPELVDIQNSMLRFSDNHIGNVYRAMTLLCIESLNTEVLEQELRIVNDEVLEVRATVDDFLASNYPNLVEFKSMDKFERPHYTIENYATIILHPAIINGEAENILFRLNAGAEAIKNDINDYITRRFGHCNILHLEMENSPVRDITLFKAIKYVANPNLYSFRKEGWMNAIQAQLRSHGCFPRKERDDTSSSISLHLENLYLPANEPRPCSRLPRIFSSYDEDYQQILLAIQNEAFESNPIAATDRVSRRQSLFSRLRRMFNS